MSNITNFNIVTTSTLLQNAINFKSNPNLIQQYTLNLLYGITNGQVDIVDPTNPFIFLLEASTINSAAAIQESIIATQRLYPSLIRTTKDLYLHMSDYDYIDIFSTPANGKFTFLVNLNDIIQNAIQVPNKPYSQITIAENSYITVGQYTFTLLYPIDILYYDNGTFLVQYDTSRPNELQPISSYILDHDIITDTNNVQWLKFSANINQIVISSQQYVMDNSEYFQQTIEYSNLYYYSRVFYLDENLNNWVEMKVTYNDQVFNPNTPTALIQVLNGSIVVNIPQIYLDNDLISSNIRVDVYTTLGEIEVNMAGYNPNQYTSVLTAINESTLNEYTNAMNNVQYIWYSDDMISGGVSTVGFNEIKQNLINNALNGRQLPITNAQAQAYTKYQGFTLVRNIDVVTDRQFKAIQSLPPSNNSFQVPSLNTSVITVSVNKTNISSDNKVLINGDTIIITPETILLNNQGTVEFLNISQRQSLNALTLSNLVNEFNNNQYLYTPFYYMIDNSTNEFITRAYWMGNPQITALNYISANATTGYKVSTNSYVITKVSSGYILTLVNTGDSGYLKLNNTEVFCQIAFKPYGQNFYVYMTAYAEPNKASNGGFIFNFNISSNFYFDINNTIDLGSFVTPITNNFTPRTPLEQVIDVMYGVDQTAVGYIANNAQLNIFNSTYTTSNATIITHEQIDVNYGTYLNNLWIKSSIYNGQPSYLTYPNNVPLLYDKPVFQTDPINGSIFNIVDGEIQYNVLYNVGDPVLDSEGNPVYAHYAGDLVLDSNGNPIQIGQSDNTYVLDMVFYDGVYRIASDPNVTNYVQLSTNTLAEWATTTMDQINNVLFEQTTIYYSPTNSNTLINCMVNSGSQVSLAANLTPVINIYLDQSSYNNTNLTNQLQITTINTVRNYLSNNTNLSNSNLINTLLSVMPNVASITISGFWDDYGYVSIINPEDNFIIDRINYLESNNVIGVKENITINFFNIDA